MPEQRIGTCSICGGDVVGHVGGWMSVQPPPPPHCTSCGAVSAAHDPIIPMRPKRKTYGEPDLSRDRCSWYWAESVLGQIETADQRRKRRLEESRKRVY